MSELHTLLSGLVFGESPRWHEDRLWFADWGAHEVLAVDRAGTSEVIVRVPSVPLCIDWLPDGLCWPLRSSGSSHTLVMWCRDV